jgi:hypothetical protein
MMERIIATFSSGDWGDRRVLLKRVLIIVGKQKPRMLEVGVDRGEILLGLSDVIGDYVGVDIVLNLKPEVVKLSRGTFVCSTSFSYWEDLFRKGGEKFDVVFVDGCHDIANATMDMVMGLSVLSEGGVMLVHDIGPKGSVEGGPRWGWNALIGVTAGGYDNFEVVGHGEGMGIIWKR